MAGSGTLGPVLPAAFDSEDDTYASSSSTAQSSSYSQQDPIQKMTTHPRPPLTPSTGVPPDMNQSHPLLPSAPASPPTPAPSPTPHARSTAWHSATTVREDSMIKEFRFEFSKLDAERKKAWLHAVVDCCDSQLLSHLQKLVSPRLKKDPFQVLPNELCFRILEFVDDPRTFVRASQVSRRWREVLSDDQAWKTLCDKHSYRRLSSDSHEGPSSIFAPNSLDLLGQLPHPSGPTSSGRLDASFVNAANQIRNLRRQRPRSTHRSHFKHRYLVDYAWRKGGRLTQKHLSPEHGVVTSLHLTKKYIVVALDTAKIHVFDTKGKQLRVLEGHVMGVWAMVPWGDMLVSGGCDRDVRVWNMASGESIHTMRGHTSTVRCLKMSDAKTAISGSRDTTLRIWDVPSGHCRSVLLGHQASVRCLEIYGDLVVSGSYDTTAKVWRISTGECLRTLQGHFSQIYAVAFDGIRIATGSLDTSVRIWDPNDGTCKAILQGHTSLVGQLQLRHNQLVSGGSDGSVRVWSLKTYAPIHRLAAHDNSVTSLQFDDSRIVSGGSDGRVKIWDLRTGALIRELSQPAEAVWRVAFEDERSVVLANRHGRTVMELWDFAPPGEDEPASPRPKLQPAAPVMTNHIKSLEGSVLMDDIQQLQFERDSDGTQQHENVDMVDAYVGAALGDRSCPMDDMAE